MKKAKNLNFLTRIFIIYFLYSYVNAFEVILKDYNLTVINQTRVSNFFESENRNTDTGDCIAKGSYWEYKSNSTNFIIYSEFEIPKVSVRTKKNVNPKNLDLNFTFLKLNKTNPVNKLEKNLVIYDLTVQHKCTNQNNWTTIQVEIFTNLESLERYEFEFLKFCENPENFTSVMTLVILFLTATIIVFFSTFSEIKFEYTEVNQEGEIKYWHGLILLIGGSLILLIIYYFYNYIDTLFTIMISLQIGLALYLCLKSIYEYLELHKLNKLDCLNRQYYKKRFNGYSIFFIIISTIIVTTYIITRNWLLNNIFGVSLVFTILSIFHIRSLKICFLLLISAFTYDVFWVYFSPLVFNKNIMVYAATSLNLPIKLEIPIISGEIHPLRRCMYLGLGDLVLPGLVIKFCYRFDFLNKSKIYYPISLLLYFASLSLSGLIIVLYNSPQPVLFYVSPTFIVFLISIAYNRNELEKIWDAEILEEKIIRELEIRNNQMDIKCFSNLAIVEGISENENRLNVSSDSDTL